MKVGDTVKVYRHIRDEKETCSYGVRHTVPIYEVKFLTITHVNQESIPYLYYTHDGIGSVYYALDYQGRSYRKTDHWDGPRATLWRRIFDDMAFDQYPMKKFSRDLTGRGFIP